MNKKGFTLVELLAVISILGFLALLITPNFLSLKNSVVNNTLKSKIDSIHNAAIDYASDRINSVPYPLNDGAYVEGDYSYSQDCFRVKIGKLIEENYLAVTTAYMNDGKEDTENRDKNYGKLLNPVNNEEMNEKFVCVRYDMNNVLNRKLVAYILGECELYGLDSFKEECYKCDSIHSPNRTDQNKCPNNN